MCCVRFDIISKRKLYLGLILFLFVAIFVNCFELGLFVLIIGPQETEILTKFLTKFKLLDIGAEQEIVSKLPVLPVPTISPTSRAISPTFPIFPTRRPTNYYFTTPPTINPKEIIRKNTKSYFNVMLTREKQLIDKNNLYLKSFIGIINCVMILMLLYVYYQYLKIDKFRNSIGTLCSALSTVLIISLFIINLYYFAHDFKYTSEPEIKLLVFNKLLRELRPLD